MSQQLNHAEETQVASGEEADGLQKQPSRCVDDNNFFLMPGIESRFLRRPVCSPDMIQIGHYFYYGKTIDP
jgi:hypothetical protein